MNNNVVSTMMLVIFTYYFAANGVSACHHIAIAPAISVSSKEQ
jgi:hypothetical protein